ncbi:MAG TPA: methyltransferase domain-containing protein [Gemmatimonadaceae bacterium]|nr:methyltransferase domain-containing protein [Gemmatimonadaceae bacterium]
MSCQQCRGIAQQFTDHSARKQLKRFRRRGPDKSTRMLIDQLRRAIRENGTERLTLLDIGAGVGAIHHELLNGIVSRATHVDASVGQLAAAREETERRGHTAAVQFIEGDFTAVAERIPSADVVTLDRVICCFDDMQQLVRLSAAKTTRFYGAVYPRDVGWMRIGLGVINLVQRIKRSPFRVFMHDPRAVDAVLKSAGLQPWSERHTAGWQVVVYRR